MRTTPHHKILPIWLTHIPCQLGCRNALHSFTDQTPHLSCHGEAENHFPRSATPTNKNPILSSEMDLGLRSATPMLTQRHQHRCTRRAALKFSIGGREPIPAIFYCEGWFPLGPDFMMCPGCLLSRSASDLFVPEGCSTYVLVVYYWFVCYLYCLCVVVLVLLFYGLTNEAQTTIKPYNHKTIKRYFERGRLHQLRGLARALYTCLGNLLSDACFEPWTSSDALALRGDNNEAIRQSCNW